MSLDKFFEWLTNWVYDGGKIIYFITESNINILGYDFSILSLCSISGLMLFLGFAVAKWIIS